MSDDLDLSTDEALISSISEHQLEELKLQPFSLLRQTIATDLCDFGGGSFFNAIITVWVCTLSPKEALKAHADMETAKLKAFEWAESRGYSMTNWDSLLQAYKRLNDEWASVSGVREKPGENGDGEETSDPNAGGQLM
jgi:hypothetical protein